MQKVAIHLWHNANDPFWERSVVRKAIQVALHWCFPAVKCNANSEISASKKTGSLTKNSLVFLQQEAELFDVLTTARQPPGSLL